MYTNAISRRDLSNIFSDTFHVTRDFVPEGHRQTINFGNSGPKVGVRVTNAAGGNTNQNVGRADLGNRNFGVL
jgi:hypothetical protein